MENLKKYQDLSFIIIYSSHQMLEIQKFCIHLTQRYKSKECSVFFIPSNKNASFLLKRINLNYAYIFTSYVF